MKICRSDMDIKTAKGKVSLADEQRVAKFVKQKFNMHYVQTPKDMPAAVDAILVDKEIKAVVETKCRYDIDSIAFFDSNYKSEWLITWEKVNKAMQIASGLCVPCIGVLFLVKPEIILIQRISHQDGRLATQIRLQTTQTQATINGGLAVRTNAYINMKSSSIYNL
jgi:hypothetical protein